MKYRKIFKWQVFAGFAFILLINFTLLGLIVDTLFKNTLDKEINTRLKTITFSVNSLLDPKVFLLTGEDVDTEIFKAYIKKLNDIKAASGIDIILMDKNGEPRISTTLDYKSIDTYSLMDKPGTQITYFDEKIPVKVYSEIFETDGYKYGYIVLYMKGKALDSFASINAIKFNIMLFMFIFALVISFLFSYFVTRRISTTVKAMEAMTKGEAQADIKITWMDELSYLQDRINAMVKNLKEMQESRYKEVQIVAMGLAHEIKNPAAAILNLAEIAQRYKTDKKKLGPALEKIKEEVLRLNTIVDKFIHFAREKEVLKDKTYILPFIQPLFKTRKGIYPQVSGIVDTDFFYVDEVLLERSMKNLIKNAFEAGAKKLNFTVTKTAGGLSMILSDDAPVIPMEHREKIFIPFFTTKKDGMGIGLAITKNIIEKHGGTITYTASENGNTFEIIIPILTEPA